MENASKALLMAGGVLLGVLILALMVTLLLSSKEFSSGYEQARQSEKIQQFNVNFTKYLGQNLNIHQVVTICNFARENDILENSTWKTKDDISGNEFKKYKLSILYSEEGYVNSVSFTETR